MVELCLRYPGRCVLCGRVAGTLRHVADIAEFFVAYVRPTNSLASTFVGAWTALLVPAWCCSCHVAHPRPVCDQHEAHLHHVSRPTLFPMDCCDELIPEWFTDGLRRWYREAFDNAQWSRWTFRWARLVPQERIRGAQWRSSTFRWAGLVPQERIRCAQCRRWLMVWLAVWEVSTVVRTNVQSLVVALSTTQGFSTFRAQTDLSNPDDGGAHGGKDALVVGAGGRARLWRSSSMLRRDRGGDSWFSGRMQQRTAEQLYVPVVLVPQERILIAQWRSLSTFQCPRDPRRAVRSWRTCAVALFWALRTFRRGRPRWLTPAGVGCRGRVAL